MTRHRVNARLLPMRLDQEHCLPPRVAGLPFPSYLCPECMDTAYKGIDLHG